MLVAVVAPPPAPLPPRFVSLSCAMRWRPQVQHGKLITPEALAVPKYKFAIMGALDSIAGIMQVRAWWGATRSRSRVG